MQAYPTNRFILIIGNKNSKNFVRDAKEKFLLKHGSIIFIPCFHKCEVSFDENLSFLSIHFNMKILFGTDVFSDLHRIIHEHKPTLLEKGLAIYDDTDSLRNASRLKSFVFDFAASKLELVNDDVIRLASKYITYKKIIDIVKDNCDASITVNMLADTMNMRREVFTRKFKRDTGISPKNFLNRFILDKASKLLLSDMNVCEVASELKFSSEYYFSRFFKKHTGLPPHRFQTSGK